MRAQNHERLKMMWPFKRRQSRGTLERFEQLNAAIALGDYAGALKVADTLGDAVWPAIKDWLRKQNTPDLYVWHSTTEFDR